MPKDFQDIVRDTLIGVLTDGAKGVLSDGAKSASENGDSSSKRGLSGLRGIALGAGAAALAPVAAKNFGRLSNVLGIEKPTELLKKPGQAVEGAGENVGEELGSSVGDKVSDKIDSSGGPAGILKDTVKGVLPFGGGGDGGSKGGATGVGQGRRMPIQQSMDVGVPLETVYNQFTQFEQWPEFMHRVKRVTQEDECTVSFVVKIWGKTKEFTAQIQTQRPDEVIKWRVSQGMTHTGIVTFHELGPRLTRVLVGFDVEPGSLVEKFARGSRHVKRAGRGDLHRFKAFMEMMENETGAWRGVIEDGELVEEHDHSYDEQRQYSDAQELLGQDGDGEEEESDDSGEEEEQSGGRSEGDARSDAGGDGRQPAGRARAASGGGQSSRSAGRQRSGSGEQGSRSGGGEASGSSRGRSGSSGTRRSQSRSGGRSSAGSGQKSQSRSGEGRSRSGGQARSGSGSGSRSGQSSGSAARSSSGRGRSSGSGSGAKAGGQRRARNDKR